MKFATLALATLATVVTAANPSCDTIKLAQTVGNDNGKQCSTNTGYQPITGAVPTDDQYKSVCFDKSCAGFLKDLMTAFPSECDITIFNPPVSLYKNLIDPIQTHCAGLGAPTVAPPTPPTTAPPPTTPAPTTPAPTTPAPTTSAPTTPAPTTPAPTTKGPTTSAPTTPAPTTPAPTTPAPTTPPKPAC